MRTQNLMRSAMFLAIVASTAVPLAAQAQSTPWLVRLRAVHIDSANKDSTGLGLSINNKWIPEVDISYFFTPQIATELVLTYPQKHTIYSNGTEIGSLKHLPPTLTVQYHFTDLGAIKPYVGAGINYTRFSDVQFNSATEGALHPTLDSSSWGLAAQVGADYLISKQVYLNLDVKYVQLGTDVYSSGVKAGTLKVDPWLVGLGVGWRF